MSKGITVGDRIKEKREEKRWSRPQLAEALDVTTTAVWNWEERGMTPRPRMLSRIAKALDVSERHLTHGGDKPKSKCPESVTEIIQNAREDIAKEMGLPLFRVQLELKVTLG